METETMERPNNVPPERVVDLNVYGPIQGEEEYHQAWYRLREAGAPDLIWTPQNGGHWVVLSGKLVNEVFLNHDVFSNRLIAVPKEIGEFGNILPMTVDPPAHGRYRNVLNTSLSPRTVRGTEDRIRELAVSLIEAVRSQGTCDFNTAYARILPIQTFLAMMDLPMEDAPKLSHLADMVVRPTGSLDQPFADLYNYIAPFAEARRGGSGDDIVTRLANGQIDGQPVDLATAMSLCVNIIIGGLDTVVNFLGYVMLFLARNPGHRQQLIDDPQLIPNAINELGRRFGLVVSTREVRQDVEIDGVTLKAGQMITVPTLMNGLDSRENENPLIVDFNRDSINQTLFGNGVHKCPGAMLARLEIRVTLEEWLARIPQFALAPDASLDFMGGVISGVKQLQLVWDANPQDALAA